MVYALDGLMTERTDQRTVEILYEYDDSRRLIDEIVDSMPGSVDPTIDRIARAYDGLGRLEKVTSYGNSAVKNQIEYGYGDFGNLTDDF